MGKLYFTRYTWLHEVIEIHTMVEVCFGLITFTFFLQSQTTVIKSQQERIESNNALADRLRSLLSKTEDKLAAVQGKD